MIGLEIYQRGLLDLLKQRGPAPVDAYLCRVAESRELAMLRDIAMWWRVFQLEAQCRFTARLLRRMGCFDESVLSYFNGNSTSPFVEELSRGFLRSLSTHPDPLVRSTSHFEYALSQVLASSSESFAILWDRNPDSVFLSLDRGTQLPPAELDHAYLMFISESIPDRISCTRRLAEID
jgi:hypothetical protein